jgi:sporulation protein YlmC with PRC-barrel domain
MALGLGLDKAVVEKAVTAGIPGLLAALASLVAKPGGAAKLSDAVTQEQPGILTNIANVLGGTGQGALIDNGVNTLSSLLGGSTTSALTSAVGRFANVDKRESNDLMGVLGPLLMGALGQQKRASGLNASGLAQLITSQKDNIARALPAGFASYLSGTGILDAVTGPTAKDLTRSEPGYSSTQWGWVLPVLGAIAIGALAWNLFSRAPTRTATLPPAKTFTATADEAKGWVGRPVYSSDGKKVGEVIEIKHDPDTKITEAYIDTGTFLGMGATQYRVTSQQIEEVMPDSLVLTLKESEVKSLPPADQSQKQ